MKKTELTMVSNREEQALVFRNYGIKPLVLEDPIPIFDDSLLFAEKENNKTHYSTHMNEDRAFKVAVVNPFQSAPLQEIWMQRRN